MVAPRLAALVPIVCMVPKFTRRVPQIVLGQRALKRELRAWPDHPRFSGGNRVRTRGASRQSIVDSASWADPGDRGRLLTVKPALWLP
jgi:hypothetical protein